MKSIEDLKNIVPVDYETIIEACPKNKSPMFYCEISFYIKTKKKKHLHHAKKIVAKGLVEEIKKKRKSQKKCYSILFYWSIRPQKENSQLRYF